MTTTDADQVRPSPDLLRRRRLTGRTALAGLALFVGSLGTFAPESTPHAGSATAAEIRRYATDNAGTLRLNALATLGCVGLLALFVASLATQVREAREGSVVPRALVLLGSVLAMQSLWLGALTSVFASPGQLDEISDGAVTTAYLLVAISEWMYSLTIAVPGMIVVGSYSYVALRHRLVARGVAWVGFAMALTGAVSVASLAVPQRAVDLFVIAIFGWWLWPLVVGGSLGVRWLRSR